MPKKKKATKPTNLEDVTKAQIEDIKFLTEDLPAYQKKSLEHILTDASNGQEIKFYEDIPYSSVLDVDGNIKGTNYMIQASHPNNDLATPWYKGKLPAYDFGNDSSIHYMNPVQDYTKTNHYNHKNPGPFKDVDKVVVMFMDKDGNPTQVMAGALTDISMENSGPYNHGNYTVYQLRIVNPAIEVMPKEAEKESGD